MFTMRNYLRPMMIIFLFMVSLYGFNSIVFADDSFDRQLKKQTMDFTYYTTDDGLAQTNVMVITQDTAGYMWFGTDDGLNKFDGYTFRVYKNDPNNPDSLSNNQIIGIEEEGDGTLWIATYRGGLNHFDPVSGKFKHILYNPLDPNSPKGLSHENINAMKKDKQGNLWIGTARGLNKWNPSTQTMSHYYFDRENTDNENINFINSLALDDQGMVWLGASSGLIRFDSKTSQFKSYRHKSQDASSISDDIITSLALDANQDIWIGTQNAGLNHFDREKEQFVTYTANPDEKKSISANKINLLYTDAQGNIWVGTDKGLNEWDSSQNGFKHTVNDLMNPQSLNGNMIFSIFQDRQLNLWVATEKGINLHTPRSIIEFNAENPSMHKLLTNTAVSFVEDKNGLIWIGTNDGIQTFDRETGLFGAYLYDPKDPLSVSKGAIISLFEDDQGVIWAGSKEGALNRFNPSTNNFTRFNDVGENHPELKQFNIILKITQKDKNELYLGTYDGLFIFDTIKGEIRKFPAASVKNYEAQFDHSRFTSMYQDKKGLTWFGTLDTGIYQYDPLENRFKHYPIYPNYSNNLASNSVSSIIEDKQGFIWAGTKGGLEKFNPLTGEYVRFTEEDGLPNNLIWGLILDNQDNLWMSTSKGLSKLDLKTMEFYNYDQSDGLQSNSFSSRSYLKLKDGDILFGGNNGFNWIRPELLHKSEFQPPIVIQSFKVFDQSRLFDTPLTDMKTIRLSYKENFFSFEFAALDYRNSARIQYAYKLDGFDKNWIYPKNRRYASYMNLKGGHYLLHIKATNSDGVWNAVEKTIELDVIPSIWQRWWAYVGYMLLVTVSLMFYMRMRSKKQAEKLQQQEQMVAARTRAIQSLMDNADQGFLSFGADLMVQKEFSLACVRFFSRNLEGRSIHSLLYPNQPLQQNKLELQLNAFFAENNLLKKSEYLDQLSCEIKLNNYTVQLDFKQIFNTNNPEDSKCMLIISDISTLRQLESQMEEADHIFAMEKLAVLGQLAAGIAHEIRNPLTVIDGFMQLMLRTELDQEKRQAYLILMHPEVKRINDLVSEFLMLAKPQVVKYESTNLFAVIKATVEFMHSEASLHNIEIILDSQDEELCIEMDAKQMKQVFMNVIKNAIEASNAGNQIRIQVVEKEATVKIVIIDQGEGISPEQLRKIFDPFFTQKDTGTGLGLTTSLNIVRNHQGDIDVESIVGIETSVIITLPLMIQA